MRFESDSLAGVLLKWPPLPKASRSLSSMSDLRLFGFSHLRRSHVWTH